MPKSKVPKQELRLTDTGLACVLCEQRTWKIAKRHGSRILCTPCALETQAEMAADLWNRSHHHSEEG